MPAAPMHDALIPFCTRPTTTDPTDPMYTIQALALTISPQSSIRQPRHPPSLVHILSSAHKMRLSLIHYLQTVAARPTNPPLPAWHAHSPNYSMSPSDPTPVLKEAAQYDALTPSAVCSLHDGPFFPYLMAWWEAFSGPKSDNG